MYSKVVMTTLTRQFGWDRWYAAAWFVTFPSFDFSFKRFNLSVLLNFSQSFTFPVLLPNWLKDLQFCFHCCFSLQNYCGANVWLQSYTDRKKNVWLILHPINRASRNFDLVTVQKNWSNPVLRHWNGESSVLRMLQILDDKVLLINNLRQFRFK